MKTPDLTNLQLKLFDNNFKRKKEKAWVWKNMQEKNTHNMKKFSISRKEEKKNSKNNMKDLTAEDFNKNNK